MAELGDDGTVTELAPMLAPQWLEHFAAFCLGAEGDDSRLGDLSEQYVRTRQRLSTDLGTAPWAMAISRLVSDVRYLAATANVMLFARAVDPGTRLVEDGAAALIALDLRERIMAILHVAVRKLVLPALLLLCSALLINSAAEVWNAWRQSEALMASVQREKAEVAAQRIDSFLSEVERQIGWVAYAQFAKLPIEQRRYDYVRLLRQVPAITILAQLDGQGHEQLNVSRLSMDVVGSDADRSAEPAFVGVKAKRIYIGPLYFRKASEPYLTMAIDNGGRSGVTVAEINLKQVWDVVNAIKAGETGYAYIVDGKGRLVAYHDVKFLLRQSDLSTLPQVAASNAASPSGEPVEGQSFDPAAAATSVLSVSAAIPRTDWKVLVDVPAAETRAALWGAIIRAAGLLVLGLVTAFLAIRFAIRPVAPAQPARA
jgi:hypothetical protein